VDLGPDARASSPLAIFLRFLRFGLQAWGGPIPQIAMMHRELVEKEQWIDEATFRRVLAVYQAIPGPEANELAVYFGYRRGGRLGGLLAGLGFLLPGLLLCLVVATLYVHHGSSLPGIDGLLYAVKPVVIALILHALIRLARNAFTNDALAHVGIAAGLLAGLAELNFVFTLLGLGLLYYVARRASRPALGLAPLGLVSLALPTLPTLLVLFLFFLQVGLFTFGGAYTAISLIQEGAVARFGWITNQQFLDALALSSLLPAPLVIAGTFVGYIAFGLPGALLATLGIYLPAFAFTLLAHEPLSRLVEDPRTHDFFDGVTAAVIGIIAVTLVHLTPPAFPDALSLVLGVAAFAALRMFHVNVALVVLSAAALGVALDLVGVV